MQFITLEEVHQSIWYQFITDKQKVLAELSVVLYMREHQANLNLQDYSFIVFPLAKVYEGFLKKYFLELHLIDEQEYNDKRFRIGRALNPDISVRHQDEHWLFDDLVRECGKEVADLLWQTWIQSRNRVFHYFPDVDDFISLADAEDHIKKLSYAMDEAVRCKLR